MTVIPSARVPVVALAVDGRTGHADSPLLSADGLGLQTAPGWNGPLADLTDDLAAHARLAAVSEDSRGWVLADIAVLIAKIHGPADWTDHLPTGQDDQPLLSVGTWQNLRTTARRWPDRAVRMRWQDEGLTRAHLTALNGAVKRDPAAAADWLERAVEGKWSVAALRRAMRGDKAPAPALDPHEASLPDDFAASLRAKLEEAGIVLLSPEWYALTTSELLGVVERHRRIEAGDDVRP